MVIFLLKLELELDEHFSSLFSPFSCFTALTLELVTEFVTLWMEGGSES